MNTVAACSPSPTGRSPTPSSPIRGFISSGTGRSRPSPPGQAHCVMPTADFSPTGTSSVCGKVMVKGEPANEIVRVDPATQEVRVFATGRDFYVSPGPRPMASALPGWNGTTPTCPGTGPSSRLGRSPIRAGRHRGGRGGPDESIFQPEWAPEGSIVFASDRAGGTCIASRAG